MSALADSEHRPEIRPGDRIRSLDHPALQSFFLDTSKRGAPVAGAANPLIVDFARTKTVLELGCGQGETIAAIGQRFGCRCTGLDLYDAAVRPQGGFEFRQGDITKLPSDLHGRFDFAFAYYVWHYFGDKLEGLRQTHLALKLGGRAVIDFGTLSIDPRHDDRLVDLLIDPQLDRILKDYPNHGQLAWERVNIFDWRGRQERRCCRVTINKTSEQPLQFPTCVWVDPNPVPRGNQQFRRALYQ